MTLEMTSLRMSLQRAMVGEVFPALRAVTVEYTSTTAHFYAYIDGSLQPEDRESISCICTEMIADFPASVTIEFHTIETFDAVPVRDPRLFVFARREP